jgi:CBS domain containing-hemolysin-like protein
VSTPVALLAAVAMLAANGFFVAAEFALLAARRTRIEALADSGDRRARHALAGIRELSLMLAGAQLGITMASLGLGAVAEPAVASLLERAIEGVAIPSGVRHAIAFAVALSIVVFLHMVVGEMAPKSWAISHPERSALALAGPFRAFALVLRPFIRLLNMLANAVVRLCGVEPQEELALAHSPGDLLLLLNESVGRGTLDVQQHDLLSRSLELSGLDALSAMTPRREIVAVQADAGVEAVEKVASESGRSRILVYEQDLDHVPGVVHVKDLLLLDEDARAETTARSLVRPVLVTHESHALEDLLLDMREQRLHLAVVVDELGTVAGLVTMEDVLEELIGEFEDESDRGARRLRRLGGGAWAAAGTLRPDELAERTGVALPDGDWDTVAGWIIAELDRIPSVGDVATVGDHVVEVTRMDGFGIEEVVVRTAAAHEAPGSFGDERGKVGGL